MDPISTIDTSEPARDAGSVLRRVKEMDERRPNLPGEHLITFTVGALLMLAGLRSRKAVRGVLLTTAGSALVGRAASGRGGVARIAKVVKKLG